MSATSSSRGSLQSLYALLSDLDDSQLSTLLTDLNNTTSQNMAVGQAISAWETSDPSASLTYARTNMDRPAMSRKLSKNLRLSLTAVFQPSTISEKRGTRNFSRPTPRSGPVVTPQKSPDSRGYKRISRPIFQSPTTDNDLSEMTVAELLTLLQAEFYNRGLARSDAHAHSPTRETGLSPISSCESMSSCSTSSPGRPISKSMRRYPSTIDMALEAQWYDLSFDLLEPRPSTSTPTTPGTPSHVNGRIIAREGSPVVMDGIFEVIGGR